MSFDTEKGGQNGKKREALWLYQKRSYTVGELKRGCNTGQESTMLIRPKPLIRAFGEFANSIRPFVIQLQGFSLFAVLLPFFCIKTHPVINVSYLAPYYEF